MRSRLVASALLAGCTGAPSPETDSDEPAATPPLCPEVVEIRSVAQVPTPPATELSGAAWAEGRLWMHNDSNPAEVHALDIANGMLATVVLEYDVRDLEDIASGIDPDGQRVLVLADIGDNASVRDSVATLTFPIPDAPGTISPSPRTLRYEDGPHDAETVLVDADGIIWVVTKEPDGLTGFYRAAGDDMLRREHTLQFGQPPLGQFRTVTAGDFGPHGLVLRTYSTEAYVWPSHADLDESLATVLAREPCSVEIGPAAQGEAVSWGPGGLYAVSEGTEPDVYLTEIRGMP